MRTLASHAVATADLTKTYGAGDSAVHALDGVSVQIPPHTFTAIMGPSGSGKSTLMHLMAGLDRPTAGTVMLGEHAIGGLGDHDLTVLRRTQVGFVFQSFNLLPMLTAQQNILLPAKLAKRAPEPGLFDQVVDRLDLRNRLGHLPSQLSGGEQQRVAVARALIMRPQVLFADEPTGALDSARGVELLDILRGAVDDLGQTVVMVTHDPAAAAYADRVLLLKDGRLAGHVDAPTTEAVAAALAGLSAR